MSRKKAEDAIVTVAVPTYNRAGLLRFTLDSLSRQDSDDFGVVVLDNASTDSTEAVVASFSDPRFRYLRNDVNIGLFRNFNRAVELNRSPYLAIVQDDDLVLPGFISRSVEALAANPVAAFSFTEVAFIDEEGCRLPDRQGDEFPPGPMRGTEYLRRIVAGENLVIHSSSVVMRRSALETSGPFDAVHARSSIDFNLYFRLASRHDLICIPDELTLIRRHAGADHLHTEADTRPLAMIAERSDAAAYLLRSELATDESFRDWLSERLLHLSMRRSETTAGLGVDLSLSGDEKLALVLEEILKLTSPGARVIVVDQNEFGLDELAGRRLLPFLERDGRYWGPPSDSEAAILELQRMREAGAGLIAILWPAFWWLDYYHAFRDYLELHFPRVAANSRLVAFDLNGKSQSARST